MAQPVGLGAVLAWGDGGGLMVPKDSLLKLAAVTAATAGPLASLAYKGKGVAVLARAASVAAAPLAVYTLAPTASALAPPAAVNESDAVVSSIVSDLKAILKVYHPVNLTKLLAKNLMIQFCMVFNKYMLAVMEHEKDAIAAEAEGRDPPPAPPMPDMAPVLDRGLYTFARELTVASTRRLYEVVAVRQLGYKKAQPLLRDSKVWIRDVLADKHRTSPLQRRLMAYAFATGHATALFYAAECTVSVLQHTHRTLKEGRKLGYWVRGVALQAVRCTVVLLAASVGSALGSLVKPGAGTLLGQLTAEIGSSIVMGILVNSLLE
ncbi:hypothetical protein GPECTOR_36g82 [Gonium pectorale]|uniref:Uncharacterized protein n=1 Tax=Gonium pectorale TaxID=33097 RepID=A0A150GDE4_GONPE|nr:hypothetical protein GPECTOR_36g82 [Gonium pectorale]|eukprot:KXZ47360.1 hypothetical protein GPECTOR_36g82 [Gonium pectorale]